MVNKVDEAHLSEVAEVVFHYKPWYRQPLHASGKPSDK